MIIKIRSVSTTNETGAVTQNNVYTVVGFADKHFVIIDDNGNLYSTIHDVNDYNRWTLESIDDIGPVALFP